jgi:tetraacyldisaccharide 4'-kinase
MFMFLPPVTRPVIYPAAKLYALGVRARIALYEKKLLKARKLNAPVISVGNLTVGGTGKTPCVAFLARFLRDEGHSVAILSRGYKRASKGRFEVSNGEEILCEPRESGDEPYLLAKLCPGVRVVVDQDRFAAGRWLEERAPVSVFILDDAYQHLQLARDLNLLLVDATEPLEEAKMVPFGRLREPIAGLRRADAVIVTRSDQLVNRNSLEDVIRRFARPNIPVFYAHHEMTGLIRLSDGQVVDPAAFAGKPVAVMSGIARPDRFIADLEGYAMEIALRRDFTDHHRYTRAEFFEIIGRAGQARAEAIITTEKDAANLPDEVVRLSEMPAFATRIEFRCESEGALKDLVRCAIQAVHR